MKNCTEAVSSENMNSQNPKGLAQFIIEGEKDEVMLLKRIAAACPQMNIDLSHNVLVFDLAV